MRNFALLACMLIASLLPAWARADDDQAPICADAEFVAAFNSAVELQALIDAPVADAAELMARGQTLLAFRQDKISPLPDCAEAIAIRRLLLQMSGDALARDALRLAPVPDQANPYLQRPDDQSRVDGAVSAMLGQDRSLALSPEDRVLPACADGQLNALERATDDLLALRMPAEASVAAIDRLLEWREADLPGLPYCDESQDLTRALNVAATDSAAQLAMELASLAGLFIPFADMLEESVADLTRWLGGRRAATAILSGAARSSIARDSQLPACATSQRADLRMSLLPDGDALLARSAAARTIDDLLDYSGDIVAFRDRRLAQLPFCAEAFYARWWLAEALADAITRQTLRLLTPGSVNLFFDEGAPGYADSRQALDRLAEALLLPARPASPGSSQCDQPELLSLVVYLLPEFWEFSRGALTAAYPEEAFDLVAPSYAMRQLLWEHLPRCQEALEIGLAMRAIAADALTMLVMELAGAPAGNIPYLGPIARDMRALFDGLSAFVSPCGSAAGGAGEYYVVAENIANVRDCGATNCGIVTTVSRGQQVNVLDDLGSWYEITLPSCETGFMAGFLLSKTPPG